jgi:hypothetical protein
VRTTISFDKQAIFDALCAAVKASGKTPVGQVVIHVQTGPRGELQEIWAEVDIEEPMRPKFEGTVPRD